MQTCTLNRFASFMPMMDLVRMTRHIQNPTQIVYKKDKTEVLQVEEIIKEGNNKIKSKYYFSIITTQHIISYKIKTFILN